MKGFTYLPVSENEVRALNMELDSRGIEVLCRDREQLVSELRAIGVLDESIILRNVNHERAHAEAAEKLGYQPIYGFRYIIKEIDKGKNLISWRAFITVHNLRREHAAQIASAPDELSADDRAWLGGAR